MNGLTYWARLDSSFSLLLPTRYTSILEPGFRWRPLGRGRLTCLAVGKKADQFLALLKPFREQHSRGSSFDSQGTSETNDKTFSRCLTWLLGVQYFLQLMHYVRMYPTNRKREGRVAYNTCCSCVPSDRPRSLWKICLLVRPWFEVGLRHSSQVLKRVVGYGCLLEFAFTELSRHTRFNWMICLCIGRIRLQTQKRDLLTKESVRQLTDKSYFCLSLGTL